MTELRRGVLGPCVLALLDERPRFGLELVRELAAAGGLLTSDGTVYPLLNRLRDAGLVTSEWQDRRGGAGAPLLLHHRRRAASSLKAFRADWAEFAATVDGVLFPAAGHQQHVKPLSPATRRPRDERHRAPSTLWSATTCARWTPRAPSLPAAQRAGAARADRRAPGRGAAPRRG